MLFFKINSRDTQTKARSGAVSTAHGDFPTPAFMPVGTQATVKTLTPQDLLNSGTDIILSNTYHLTLRPGEELVRKMGGLHRFIGWNRPILTDSGGFQIFSLPKLNRVSDEGVSFQSHIDGAPLFLGPEKVMLIQQALGSDIIMPLDQPLKFPAEKEMARVAMERTLLWAQKSRQMKLENQSLFGIIQGGTYPDLRNECARRMCEMDFPGYAIGGLSLGESKELLFETLAGFIDAIPAGRPRYLMGFGTPQDIVEAVALGVDMFDCILPTRVGRNGWAYTARGVIRMRNARFKDDPLPLEEDCPCYACRNFSRAYLKHLFNAEEILGLTMVSLHNIYFYQRLMARIRSSIADGTFGEFLRESRGWEK